MPKFIVWCLYYVFYFFNQFIRIKRFCECACYTGLVNKMERAAAEGDADEAVKHYDELKCVFDKLIEFLSQPDCIEVAKKMDQLALERAKD